jgi:hypothetical protein
MVKLGRPDDRNRSTAGSVTLHACSASDVKLVKGCKCCSPAFVTFEFAMFSETSPTMPTDPTQQGTFRLYKSCNISMGCKITTLLDKHGLCLKCVDDRKIMIGYM